MNVEMIRISGVLATSSSHEPPFLSGHIESCCHARKGAIEFALCAVFFASAVFFSVNSVSAQSFSFDFTSLNGLTIDSGASDNGLIAGPIMGRSDLYFGGVTPAGGPGIYGGNAATFIAPSSLNFDLNAGPVTLKGAFLNRDQTVLRNESYIWFGPNATTLPNPISAFPVNAREGIKFGGGTSNTMTILVNDGDAITAPTTVTSFSPSLPLNQWYDMGATIEIVSGNLQVTPFVNTTVYAPQSLGPVGNFPWINNLRAGIGVDDLSDGFMARSCSDPASLATLIDDMNPICSGDKVFSEFSYSPIGDMPSADDIIVHPISRIDPNTGEEHFGIRFQGAFIDTSSGGPSDALIDFKVEAPDGKLIKDVHMQANPLVIGGDGFVSVTETFLPENEHTVLSVYDIQPGSRKLQDWQDLVDENGNLQPERSLHVQKDIIAWAQEVGSVATMSFIDQTFSQCDELLEFDPNTMEPIPTGECAPPMPPRPDFNGDGVSDDLDIDMLTAAIRGMVGDPQYDLNHDSSVDSADLTFLVEDVFKTWFGDANLDGIVDGQDFIDWNGSKFMTGTGWGTGDFNGDGVTDGADFVLWNEHKFETARAPESVPEPSTSLLVLVASGFLGVCKRTKISAEACVLPPTRKRYDASV